MGFFTYSLQNYWIIVQIKTKITLKPCLSLFLMCLCKGCLKEGCELIGQALALFTNVYGALHQDVCVCLRLLGRIHYILGEYAEVSHVLQYDWSSNKYDKKQLWNNEWSVFDAVRRSVTSRGLCWSVRESWELSIPALYRNT